MKKTKVFNVRGVEVVVEQEKDGRFIAEIDDLPGCLAYGDTKRDALIEVLALGVSTLKEKVDLAKDCLR